MVQMWPEALWEDVWREGVGHWKWLMLLESQRGESEVTGEVQTVRSGHQWKLDQANLSQKIWEGYVCIVSPK